MKTRHIASGIAATIGLLGALGITGCGADVGDQGAAGEGEIGSTEQAIVNGQSVMFGASIKLDSSILNSNGNADNLVLWAGGEDGTGAAVNTIGTYDRQTDTFTALRNAANTADIVLTNALVEPDIIQIPGVPTDFLIAGGRLARDGAAQTDSYLLRLTLAANKIASATITKINMGQARVLKLHTLKQCGTSTKKKIVAIAGITDDGFQDMRAITATNSVEVFTYDPNNDGNPADAAWSTLKDASGNTITLTTARGYHDVFDADPSSHLTFYAAGGMNANATALDTTEKLVVDSECVSQNDTAFNKVPQITDLMPSARARADSIAFTTNNIDVDGAGSEPSRVYEFVMAGGNDLTNVRPTSVLLFDVTADQWVTFNSIQEGKLFPRFLNGAGGVRLVTGIKPDNTNAGTQASDPYFLTSLTVDVPAAAGTWSTGTALGTGRYGTFVEAIKNGAGASANYLGFGATHTNTLGNVSVNPTTMQTTVVTF